MSTTDRCALCGYQLLGTSPRQCPECGDRIRRVGVADRPIAPRWWRARLLAWRTLFLGAFALLASGSLALFTLLRVGDGDSFRTALLALAPFVAAGLLLMTAAAWFLARYGPSPAHARRSVASRSAHAATALALPPALVAAAFGCAVAPPQFSPAFVALALVWNRLDLATTRREADDFLRLSGRHGLAPRTRTLPLTLLLAAGLTFLVAWLVAAAAAGPLAAHAFTLPPTLDALRAASVALIALSALRLLVVRLTTAAVVIHRTRRRVERVLPVHRPRLALA
mgnify:CR=1 FL=1